MVLEKAVRRAAFEQLQSFFVAHAFGEGNECMDMVWHDRDYANFYVMVRSSPADRRFTKVFIGKLPKHLVAVFGLPVHMPEIDADFVVVMLQRYGFHGLSSGEESSR